MEKKPMCAPKRKRIRSICMDCGKHSASYGAKRCRNCNTKHIQPAIPIKEYRRNWHLKKKYGLDANEFEVYWNASYGKCYICEKKMKYPEYKRGQDLDVVAVDHDHKTGRMRGLLCNACNKGLGFFKDDVIILTKAVRYLGG